MKVSEKVRQILSTEPRWNVLATTSPEGKVNIAMFGSVELSDDETLIAMLGDNRSYTNLKSNPLAACMVILPGQTGMQTQGCRLYLRVRATADDGEVWEQCKARIKSRIGNAAEILKHYVCFGVLEARPLLDLGQGI
ncbi:MAG: pyridoxamine 5'-phosphate oxidase family protein [Dehalococcoidia bacterium]|nr:pyridoxamine 5'-phosphate oxidase family protein [Dehalococcoidia bacterium]